MRVVPYFPLSAWIALPGAANTTTSAPRAGFPEGSGIRNIRFEINAAHSVRIRLRRSPYFPLKGVISLPGVFLNEDDNFDIALRRFKKQVEKAGILSEMKKRQHYEKPSVMRKKKKAAARKRLLKKMRKINMG